MKTAALTAAAALAAYRARPAYAPLRRAYLRAAYLRAAYRAAPTAALAARYAARLTRRA